MSRRIWPHTAVTAGFLVALAGAATDSVLLAQNIRVPKEPEAARYIHCAAVIAVSPCSWELDPGMRQMNGERPVEPPYAPPIEPTRPPAGFDERFSPAR